MTRPKRLSWHSIGDWDALMQGVLWAAPVADDAQLLVNLGPVDCDGERTPDRDGLVDWVRAQEWRRFGWYVWDWPSDGWRLPTPVPRDPREISRAFRGAGDRHPPGWRRS